MASSFQNKNIRIVFLVYLLACVGFFIPSFVFAEEQQGILSVSPLFTDITLDESTSEQAFFLDLTNKTSNPVVLRLSLVDFGSLSESGGIAFLGNQGNGMNRYALASWITPEKDVITLLPDTNEKLKFTVINRDSLSPGGHYAAVLFVIEKEGGQDEDSMQPSEISVSPTFSALVFAKKEGGSIRELALKEDIINEHSWLTGLPTKVSLRFHNSGNIDLLPRGRFVLTDPFGRMEAKGIINEESGRILPESFRWYHTTLLPMQTSFIPGFYTLSVEYRFEGEETAHTLSIQSVFAWGVAVWLGVGCIGFVGGIYFLKRVLKRKK